MSGHVHTYRATCAWSGSTAVGYERYPRAHTATAPPAGARLELSGDAAFLGDGGRLNPEQLVVVAASSCQLLAFIALAARSRVDVREYADEAEGVMPEDDRPVRIVRIVLRPRIVLAPGSDVDRARRLVHKAHEECYVANSLKTEVVVEPELLVAAS